MADERETRELLAAISIAYPGRFRLDSDPQVLQATVDLWCGLLADLPPGKALSACRALIASGVHPPAISEVRAEALSVRLVKGRPEAGEAWGEVVKAIGRWGRNRYEEARRGFSSTAVERSIHAAGGWLLLCTSDNQTADRARFCDHYAAQVESAEQAVLKGRAKSISEALGVGKDSSGTAKALPAPVAQLVAKVARR